MRRFVYALVLVARIANAAEPAEQNGVKLPLAHDNTAEHLPIDNHACWVWTTEKKVRVHGRSRVVVVYGTQC
jgi:hypothetical protein